MTRLIWCRKLKKEAEGLDAAPYPGELGQRIFTSISNEAWQLWLARQKMLLNEYRLSMVDPEARKMLRTEMEKFLFSDEDAATPPGYVPPTQDK